MSAIAVIIVVDQIVGIIVIIVGVICIMVGLIDITHRYNMYN